MYKGLNVIMGFACNLKCSFCSQKDQPPIPTDDEAITVSLQNALKTSPDITKINFLGGEPLLYPGLLDKYVGICLKHNPEIIISITTNGTLWHKGFTKWANANNILVDVSIDGILEGQKPLCNLNLDALKEVKKLYVNTVYTLDDQKWADTLYAADKILDCYKLAVALDSTDTRALMNPKNIYEVMKRKNLLKKYTGHFFIKNMFSEFCDCNTQGHILPNGKIKTTKEHLNMTKEPNCQGCSMVQGRVPEFYPVIKELFN